MGYRFSVRRLDYPSRLEPGDSMHLYFWIENRGCAPIYHSCDFIIRLRGEGGVYDFTTNANVCAWLPGDNLYDTVLQLPDTMPDGDYTIEVGIRCGNELVLIATDSPKNDGFSEVSGIVKIKS